MTDIKIVLYVWYIQVTDHRAADLFYPACVRALAKVGSSHTNDEELVLLPYNMRLNIPKRGLLHIISHFAINPV